MYHFQIERKEEGQKGGKKKERKRQKKGVQSVTEERGHKKGWKFIKLTAGQPFLMRLKGQVLADKPQGTWLTAGEAQYDEPMS